MSLYAGGSDEKTIITECRYPNGIIVDVEAQHIYWTDMGVPNLNGSFIMHAFIVLFTVDTSLNIV